MYCAGNCLVARRNRTAIVLIFDRELSFTDGAFLLAGLAYILWQLLRSEQEADRGKCLASELEAARNEAKQRLVLAIRRIGRITRLGATTGLRRDTDSLRPWH